MSGTIAKTGENAIVNQRLRRIQVRVVKLLEDGTIPDTDKVNGLYVEDVSGTPELFFSGNQLTEGGEVLDYWITDGSGIRLRDEYTSVSVNNHGITNIGWLDLSRNETLPAGAGSALVDVSGSLYYDGNLVYSPDISVNHPWEIAAGVISTNPPGLNLKIDGTSKLNNEVRVVANDAGGGQVSTFINSGNNNTHGFIATGNKSDGSRADTSTEIGTGFKLIYNTSGNFEIARNAYSTTNTNVMTISRADGTTSFASPVIINNTQTTSNTATFNGHVDANSSVTIDGTLTSNGTTDLNSTTNLNASGSVHQYGDYTAESTAQTYISDQDRFYWYEADWVNHINPTNFASGGYVDSATFSGDRTAGYKTQDLMTNYPGYFYLYKSWNRVVNEASYTMSVGGEVNGVSTQNRTFTPRYKLNSSTYFNGDGGSVSPADENLLECDNLSVATILSTPRLVATDILIGTASINKMNATAFETIKGLFDFVDGVGGVIAQIADAVAELGSAVIIGGSILGGSILAGGAIGAGIAFGGSTEGNEQRADGTASQYNSAFFGKPTDSPYDLSYASYFQQPIGFALSPNGTALAPTDASMDNLLYTFGINQKNSTFNFNAVSNTNELTGVITTLPESVVYGNSDKSTGINYPVVGQQVLTGFSHTPKVFSVELNDYTTAWSGKYLDINSRTYEDLSTNNRIYSIDNTLYHSGKRVGDQLPSVILLGQHDGGLDDVMGISMETAVGFSPAKNYFIGTQNGTFGMDAIQSNSVDSLGNTLGLEIKVGDQYYIDCAGKSTGANTDPSAVIIYKPLILDDGVNPKYNIGDWVYDLSVNGSGGTGVFTGVGSVATLDASYTTLDASQADILYSSLQSRYNNVGTNGLSKIEPTTASTTTISQTQPSGTSIGGRINFKTDTPTISEQTQFVVNGTYDEI